MGRRREMLLAAGAGSGFVPELGEWTAGANTTLSHVDDEARATLTANSNQRISRLVGGLTPGQDYVFGLFVNPATSGGIIITRVSATQNLDAGDYGMNNSSQDELVGIPFTAPLSGEVYAGIVGVNANIGAYIACSWDVTVTEA